MRELADLALSRPLPDGLETELRRAYAEPPRAYHTFAHVLEVLGHFERVPDWVDRDAVALAILFHDAVYVAGRADNEARSAQLAAERLAGTPFERSVPRVRELILLTAKHGSHDPSKLDRDAARFLDCDMAILAAPEREYDVYARAIAAEHAHVPRALYRAGRARFLAKLLASPRIFLSDAFADREAPARRNLASELDGLR